MKNIITILFVIISFAVKAQFGGTSDTEPVKINVTDSVVGDEVHVSIHFNLEKNWMVYDSIIGDGGPIPFSYQILSQQGLKLIKVVKPQLKKKHDELMGVDVYYFDKGVDYQLVFQKTSSEYSYTGALEYMCCNLVTGICLPPTNKEFSSK